MYNGSIQGLGPRYCPSIEDKINRFAERERHQIFVEPEGWNTVEVYVNGFSTSLPEDVQLRALREIPGFEKAKIFRPGYAIEYDFFPPTQLYHSLETRIISNLYFAGQINGTTGYEEAASQGLMAGINAHLKINEKEALVLRRDEAYIGVLIDDLVSKGTEEPYRMFTSRAEYRITLRQDNADERLTPLSYALGLASASRMQQVESKTKQRSDIQQYLEQTSIKPEEINPLLESLGSAMITEKQKLHKLLLRPQVDLDTLMTIDGIRNSLRSFDTDALASAETLIKYGNYLEKEKENANKLKRLENIKIHADFDFKKLKSLSKEAMEKLTKNKPETIGQASRISGVTPADISILLVYFGR
jgi:tRNA uridine 5-carboxymethylaminomethyl modification enzyme